MEAFLYLWVLVQLGWAHGNDQPRSQPAGPLGEITHFQKPPGNQPQPQEARLLSDPTRWQHCAPSLSPARGSEALGFVAWRGRSQPAGVHLLRPPRSLGGPGAVGSLPCTLEPLPHGVEQHSSASFPCSHAVLSFLSTNGNSLIPPTVLLTSVPTIDMVPGTSVHFPI